MKRSNFAAPLDTTQEESSSIVLPVVHNRRLNSEIVQQRSPSSGDCMEIPCGSNALNIYFTCVIYSIRQEMRWTLGFS
jgi:hypothetical protein